MSLLSDQSIKNVAVRIQLIRYIRISIKIVISFIKKTNILFL